MSKLIYSICAIIVVFVVALYLRNVVDVFPQASPPEIEDENYRRGKSLAMEHKDAEAMEAFYKVVDARSEAPESHLELGILALRREMPVDAVYHFRQYTRQSTDDRQKKLVEEQMKAAKKMFIRELPGMPFRTESAAPDLEKKYTELKKENDRLKGELGMQAARIRDLEARLSIPSTPPSSGTQVVASRSPENSVRVPDPVAPGRPAIPATHTIVKGDSLTSISRKYYGTQNRWRDIYNHNRDVLSTPSSLKIGVKLKLPQQ